MADKPVSRFLESYRKRARRLVSGLRRDPAEIADERVAIRAQIEVSSVFHAPYATMNLLATVVAAYGLLADSPAVVIGAMVIAQLLGPINGISLALVDGDLRLLRKALLTELGGVAIVLGTAFLIAAAHAGTPLTHEILARTQPSLFDLMIALGGGAAGAYSAASPRLSNGLVGVAIATALVPPLAASAICLANGAADRAGGAFLLFLINLVAIQFATSVVLWALGYHKLFARQESGLGFVRRNAPSAILILALGFGLFSGLSGTLRRSRELSALRDNLDRQLTDRPGVQLADLQVTRSDRRRIIVATVRTPFSFTPKQVAELERLLPVTPDGANELHVRSVLIKEADADRYLHQEAGVRSSLPVQAPVDSAPINVP